MSRPELVIVSGPPASGKSTLARPLAEELGLPLFEKDVIKERLANCMGEVRFEVSRSLGLAATLMLSDIARELLATHRSVMLESFFHHGKAERELGTLCGMANTVLVHLSASPEILVRRYSARMASVDRHAVHEIGSQLENLRTYLMDGTTLPLNLPVPRVIVSTDLAFPTASTIAPIVRRLLDHATPNVPMEEYWP